MTARTSTSSIRDKGVSRKHEPADLLDGVVVDAWTRWLQTDHVIEAINRKLDEKRRTGSVAEVERCSR